MDRRIDLICARTLADSRSLTLRPGKQLPQVEQIEREAEEDEARALPLGVGLQSLTAEVSDEWRT